MESLNKVLKVANVLRILYTVCYILCIVGTVCCLLGGLLFTALEGTGAFDDAEIMDMIGDFSDLMDVNQFYSIDLIMYAAGIICLAMTVVYVFASRFYKYVQTAGDPFDRTVICKMQTLGILYIVLPIAANLVSELFLSGFTRIHLSVSNTPQVTMGVVYLVLTVVFSYAADLREGKKTESEAAPAPVTDEHEKQK